MKNRPKKNTTSGINRRAFLKTASAAAAAPFILPSNAWGKNAPSERMNVGVIGLGTRGTPDMKIFMSNPDVQIRALCDVNTASKGYRNEEAVMGREPALKIANDYYAKKLGQGSYNGIDATTEFQEILGRDDIDVVALVVPDHWHAPMTIAAANAGKDIFCQKPMTLTLAEGPQMIKAVRDNKRILQTASQYRSNFRARHICELVRNGYIGELKSMHVNIGFNNKVGPGPGWKPTPVPEGFDYQRWIGPAPMVLHHVMRCIYKFRFGLDYSGGQITNLGAHSLDIAQWGNGTDHTGPVEVEGLDAKWLPEGSLFTTALEAKFRARYANGVELFGESNDDYMGVRFEGTEGWVKYGLFGKVEASSKAIETAKLGPNDLRLPVSNPEKSFKNMKGYYEDHVRNFLDSVKSRKDPLEPVEVGHRTASVAHLWNIGIQRMGKVLEWDPKKEEFTNDDEANAMRSRPAREWT
jgi:predicted dehydrogenase